MNKNYTMKEYIGAALIASDYQVIYGIDDLMWITADEPDSA